MVSKATGGLKNLPTNLTGTLWDGQGTSYTPGEDKMYDLAAVSEAKESLDGQGLAPADYVR